MSIGSSGSKVVEDEDLAGRGWIRDGIGSMFVVDMYVGSRSEGSKLL